MYPSASTNRSRSMGMGQNEGMLFAPGSSEQAIKEAAEAKPDLVLMARNL
jgi:hypothetical protein